MCVVLSCEAVRQALCCLLLVRALVVLFLRGKNDISIYLMIALINIQREFLFIFNSCASFIHSFFFFFGHIRNSDTSMYPTPGVVTTTTYGVTPAPIIAPAPHVMMAPPPMMGHPMMPPPMMSPMMGAPMMGYPSVPSMWRSQINWSDAYNRYEKKDGCPRVTLSV